MKQTQPILHNASDRAPRGMSRRTFVVIGAASVGVAQAWAAEGEEREWGGGKVVRYPDPSIVVLDGRFGQYKVGNAAIERLWTGARWAEGCAWNGGGQYLVWSDIPNDRMLPRLEEDGHVSEYLKPSNNANGNTFDFEGRLLSCEHNTRRVVRHEHSGAVTVLADQWNGKPLNAPNDIVVHPDGGIWFTDPGYGIMGDYEGTGRNWKSRKPSTALIRRPARWTSSAMTATNRTGCVSRRITRSCTWPIRADPIQKA